MKANASRARTFSRTDIPRWWDLRDKLKFFKTRDL